MIRPHRDFAATTALLLARIADGVRDRRGTAAIEFGIFAAVLGLVLTSITDVGLAVYRKMQVENAAQAGAQYAMLHGFNSSAIQSAVSNATASTTISAPTPAQFCGCPGASGVTTATCGSTCSSGSTAGTYTTVYAQASYETILNYQIVPQSYTVTSQATTRLQ